MTIVPFLNKVNAVIINPLLTLLFAVTTIYLVYAVVKVITAPATEREKAKDNMLYTIVGIFVIVSVYGLLNFVLNSFDIPQPEYLKNEL